LLIIYDKEIIKICNQLGSYLMGRKRRVFISETTEKQMEPQTENQNARQMEYKNELKEAVQSRERI